ncbi:Extracellular calcium-sensing receptor [Larimichthys crocea]|uniref:Extracellular calcium-sensing receptor n=1 Tax=Larimichthys crocea TaxID=215358 RepID=A0A6G0IUJ6_LARCR|nr:Extracellular calcium-sensing receptor [Larimichthys crocea]
MHMPGDVILGGLFEVHYTSVFPELTFTSEPHQLICQGFDPPAFRHAMTMAFAIYEINKNSNLLPNVTLGYSLYDNCATLVIGFSAALSLASGREEQFLLQENCFGTPPVLGIVGDSFSTFSIATSDVIGLFKLPIVRAMIQILKRFGWTWAGLLVSDDDYGLHVARSLKSDLTQSGGSCLAYTEILPWGDNPAELKRIVEVMKKSTARVVIVFAHQIHMIQLMDELMYYLEKVNFTTPFGDEVSFDENGDALPIYDIMNWLWLPDGRTKVQNVGEVKRSALKGEELTIDEDKIFWNFDSKQTPWSAPVVQRTSGPAPSVTTVFLKRQEFLSYHEPLGICLTAASLLGTFICAVVLGIFTYHRSTPMVRANNSELSFPALGFT